MWAIILHGGAKTIENEDSSANRAGCKQALQAGIAVLARGCSSIDAAEAAVRALENNRTFNAGRGSTPNVDGRVETCAAIMEGRGLNIGAIAAARRILNPISVARAMLFEKPVLLAGEGATRFALEAGLPLCSPQEMEELRETRPVQESRHDTVGCLALDHQGTLAAAVSTGGLQGTLPGRVGDSPLPGCGFYCDDQVGGVVFSGDGEEIARTMLGARVMQALKELSPRTAVEEALTYMKRVGGEAGGIVLTKDGQLGWAHNSDHFAVAHASSANPEPKIYLKQTEERHDEREGF